MTTEEVNAANARRPGDRPEEAPPFQLRRKTNDQWHPVKIPETGPESRNVLGRCPSGKIVASDTIIKRRPPVKVTEVLDPFSNIPRSGDYAGSNR